MKPVVLPELTWRQSPNASSRHSAPVHLVVVHRPVGGYQSSIAWLCNPKAQASAHVITNGAHEATQLVAWDEKAWACMAYNAVSDNIEVDDNAWATGPTHDPDAFHVAARIVAFRCKVRGIPPVWTRNPGVPGVTRHLDLGLAGGGHTDPTADDTLWTHFMGLVAAEYRKGGFRKVWGR